MALVLLNTGPRTAALITAPEGAIEPSQWPHLTDEQLRQPPARPSAARATPPTPRTPRRPSERPDEATSSWRRRGPRLAGDRAGSAKAIDHSAEMVALSRERNADAIATGRLTIEQADAERLPFADEGFTAAVLTNVFFSLYQPECVLVELHRVLVSGGRLAIHTAAPGVPAWIAPISRRMRFYDDAQLVQMLVAAGFSDATVTRTTDGRGQLATAHRP